MKLCKSTKTNINQDENMPYSETAEVELVHCNIVSNDYQHKSKVFYKFVANKWFDQLLDK